MQAAVPGDVKAAVVRSASKVFSRLISALMADPVTVDAEAGTLTLRVDGAANDMQPAGYIVEATPDLSAGRRNASSAFRVIAPKVAIANLGGATGTLGTAYAARFGVPAVGHAAPGAGEPVQGRPEDSQPGVECDRRRGLSGTTSSEF